MSEKFENQEQSELLLRYELAMERLQALTVLGEEPLLSESMQIYVNQIAIGMIRNLKPDETEKQKEVVACTDETNNLNDEMLCTYDFDGYTADCLEEDFGPVLFPYLSCAAYMFQWVKVFRQRGLMEACIIHMELFLELVGILRDGAVDRLSEKKLAHHLQQSLYYFISDYVELLFRDYLGYWLAWACGIRMDDSFCLPLHQAHAGDLALFLNHNLKERILMQDSLWDGVHMRMLAENEKVLAQYHPKQLKLIKSLRERLLDS